MVEREHESESLEHLDSQLVDCLALEEQLSVALLKVRREAAGRFSAAVQQQFSRVALMNATFEATCGGTDGSQVEFCFAPNPGHAAGPLHQIASGGELSRVLLAMSLVTVADDVVVIFDEIDAGVGGSVAQQIGECLQELSRAQQVIVVTHLASVAARADRHFVIEKMMTEGSTMTTVREVSGESRVSEIARMLAGESELRESRALAERLLAG